MDLSGKLSQASCHLYLVCLLLVVGFSVKIDGFSTLGGGKTLIAQNTYPETWSNPTGAVLREIVPDSVWVAERPFVWNSIDVGGADGGAVLRLRDGGLWAHSPVALDAPLRAALADLGPVRHVVSPNYEHVKYAQNWIEAYPDAISYGCPGMKQQEPDIAFQKILSTGEDTISWLDEIDCCWFDCEHNPFTRKPFFNEVLFHHRESKTLLTTDLYWNYPSGPDVPFGTKAWKFGMDEVYLPFYKNLMITDKGEFQKRVDNVLGWEFERIIPCHGSIVEQGSKKFFTSHFE
eukprot:CAMPEP_0194672968 /NCGR_PEP_ID=MMETSP0295-20121207/6785_1 /TAXON_ID=39354 /ORGANISM="Heterosigma akashiwo, Strain CCMP2393" /LENGTH=289 /DNA_ID=CAMNT_0039556827 /DNA_START=76 /DNA_END=944 /DNA_ORIENTATION=-